MIDFFMKDKCDVYTKTIVTEGAGDVVSWSKDRSIKAYIEPVNGERLFGTELGNNENISFIIYTKNIIFFMFL